MQLDSILHYVYGAKNVQTINIYQLIDSLTTGKSDL